MCGEGSPARRGATLSMNVSGVDVTYPMFSRIWRCFIMFHFYLNPADIASAETSACLIIILIAIERSTRSVANR